MVQLLADSFVLEFLGIQLIFWGERGVWRKGKGRGKERSDREVKRCVKHPFQQNDRSKRNRQTESTEEWEGEKKSLEKNMKHDAMSNFSMLLRIYLQ